MKYCELTEVKEALDKKGMKYKEVRINGGILLYVNGLMQIQKPTKNDTEKFWPEVRVSFHEGDTGYYVKACGAIYKNQSLEQVLEHIEKWI